MSMEDTLFCLSYPPRTVVWKGALAGVEEGLYGDGRSPRLTTPGFAVRWNGEVERGADVPPLPVADPRRDVGSRPNDHS